MNRIKDIPLNDRPRERIKNYGIGCLSNEELLAVIIKDGTKSLSSKDIARIILNRYKIDELLSITYEELIQIKGIGISKSCSILASIELTKRLILNNDIKSISIKNTKDIYNYYKNKIGLKKQECFYVIYLDTKNTIIKDKLLFIGTVNFSMVHPREIFKYAYILSATSIICIHNHPSGNTLPSNEDYNLTNRLKQVGNLLGINVLDHIIISKNNYYSFKENGDI